MKTVPLLTLVDCEEAAKASVIQTDDYYDQNFEMYASENWVAFHASPKGKAIVTY